MSDPDEEDDEERCSCRDKSAFDCHGCCSCQCTDCEYKRFEAAQEDKMNEELYGDMWR